MGLVDPHPDFIPDASLPPSYELCVDRLPRRKAGWQGMPGTPGLHHIGDRVQHQSPIVCIGSASALCRWEQRHKTTPDYLQYVRGRGSRLLVTRLVIPPFPLAVVVIACPRLMPPPPPGPAQQRCCMALNNQDDVPEQASNFGAAQPERSPRWTLKAAKLGVSGRFGCPFFGATCTPVSARITTKNACAHMANVMCRYQPVQLRTS